MRGHTMLKTQIFTHLPEATVTTEDEAFLLRRASKIIKVRFICLWVDGVCMQRQLKEVLSAVGSVANSKVVTNVPCAYLVQPFEAHFRKQSLFP